MKRIIKNWILIILGFFTLTPLIWFYGRSGYLINGVDTNFPLDPTSWLQRRFYVWNAITNAGNDFSSSTAGAFFHFLQFIPTQLGFSLQTTQILSLIFWFGLIIFSSYLLAKIIFAKNRFAQLLFVTFYSFNIYLFNTWENVKVANLALVAGIPLGIALLLLSNKKEITKLKLLLYSFLLGIILSGSGINPSYFITFWFTILIFFLADIFFDENKNHIFKIKNLAILALGVILANCFWLLPTLSFIFSSVSPANSIDKIGFTNWVQSLSANTSILNTMRLQGAWDWYAVDSVSGLPLYIPYALNYFYKLPFVLFSFIITTFAISAFLLKRKEKKVLYISFGLMFLIGIFLGSGTHEPTGFLFNWLFKIIPFFSLFRSPWYIFSPMTTLSLAGLIGLFVYNLKTSKYISLLLTLSLLVGNLLYTYPLITGKIYRPLKPDSFFVKFPDYIFDAQNSLKESSLKGRIIGYPDDEIEKFEWGFTGIESILGLLGDWETLFSSLNSPDSPVSKIVKDFYLNIKRKEFVAASNLAAKLNVGVIFEKLDQQSLSPDIDSRVYDKTPQVFGKWAFHEIPENIFQGKISSAKNVYYGFPYDKSTEILKTLNKNDVLLNPKDSVLAKIPELSRLEKTGIVSENSQAVELYSSLYAPSQLSYRFKLRDPNKLEYRFVVPKDGFYAPILERYRIEEFGLSVDSISLTLDGLEQNWTSTEVSDSYIRFTGIKLNKGEHLVKLNINSTDLVQSYTYEGKGEFVEEETIDGTSLTVINKSGQDVFAKFPVNSFDPMADYLIQFKYKQIYGNNAEALVSQGNKNTLVKSINEKLPNYPEWNDFSFYYEPVRTDSYLSIELIAPWTKDPVGTKVLYDDLSVFKVFTNDLMFLEEGPNSELSQPTIKFEKKSPVLYEGEVSGVTGPHIIVFSENYSPDWLIAVQTDLGNKLSLKPLHFSANLYANAWYFEEMPDKYKIKITYRRQKLFNIGMFVTILSGIMALALNFSRKRK